MNCGDATCGSGRRRAAAVPLRWLLAAVLAAVLVACGGGGAPDAAPPAASTGAPTGTGTGTGGGGSAAPSGFRGNVVLGSPTDRSVRANVFAPDQGGEVWIEYGTTPGVYERQTAAQTLAVGRPAELLIDGLQPDTDYVYRLQFRSADGTGSGPGDAWRFHTARAPGSGFSFAIQGDSHPERLGSQFDPALYQRTLLTAAADRPDFYIAMGDDFSVDTLNPTTINAAQVTERYTLQRPSWASPIHQLMVDNRVTIFFQGHDHIWATQQLDGVIYQTLPEPADPNYALYYADAYVSGERLSNTGYARVTVAPTGVKVEYVRTYLPKDEGVGRTSGSVAYSYTLP